MFLFDVLVWKVVPLQYQNLNEGKKKQSFRMKKSDKKDFQELLEDLERQGWQPMVCDSPVPFYDNAVMCGVPNGVGDTVRETMLLPKELLLKSASNLNDNLNCSKELEHYAS